MAPSIFNDRAVSNFFNSAGIPTGIYKQDQRMDYITGSTQAVIKLANPLTAVGGISVSYPMINMKVGDGSFQNFNPGTQTQFRGSLIYEPIEGLNFYASYSQSFQPNLRIDVNYKVLKPVQGEQYEVGAKYALNKQLLLSIALFQINESNVAVFDMTSPSGQGLYRPAGVRHRGAEFEATGYLTDNWQIKAGGALLDPVVRTDSSKPESVGQVRAWLPQTSANLFTTYSFPNGLSIGGGGRYVGSVKTSYDGSTAPLPSYLVLDIMATYTLGKFRLQFNMKNLLDEHYVVPSPIFQSLSAGLFPGTPRTFMLSLRRDF
jgi:iron complex outermembrane receptor protein